MLAPTDSNKIRRNVTGLLCKANYLRSDLEYSVRVMPVCFLNTEEK